VFDGSTLTYILVNTVIEQQTEMTTLKSENKALKEELEKMNKQIIQQNQLTETVLERLKSLEKMAKGHSK
jgi:cell division protein FtsB